MDEKQLVKLDCRICDKPIGKQGVYFHNEAAGTTQTFAEIYLNLFGIEPKDGPQDLCWNCSKVLISTFQLRKRIKENEKILMTLNGRDSSGSISADQKVINFSKVKTEKDNEKEVDPMIESVVVKIEPSVQLEMEVSDDECSSDDEPLQKFASKKKGKGTPRPKRVEDFTIECPLCDFKSNVKDTYQKHVYRVHNRQEMKCDGCEESFHLIYLLHQHREVEHNFTHEYQVVTKPMPETNKSGHGDEEEETIHCPLCDYQSNVKNNYQKHVIRTHNRQEMKCEECDEKHHLIYILEEHRREKHGLTSPYVADESLKLKTFDKRFGSFKRRSNGECMGENEDTSGKNYPCPLCSYCSNRVTRFSDHYKNMHDNIEMTCDGCSAKFHLYYRLLEHRKLDHNFDHEYIVPESIILEDKNRKEQRRIEKGQHFPCPECDRWFTERRNVAKHLRVVHKYMEYKTADLKMKTIEGLDPNLFAKKKYVYPKVVCSFCGKLYPNSSLENHIRNRHPEQRDPYVCDHCDHKAKTKTLLLVHMFKIHNFEVRLSEHHKAKAKSSAKRQTDSNVIKTPQGTTEYLCRYCPERYPFRVSRKRHEVSTHTFDWPYSCELCDKKFILQFELKKHLHRHMEGKRLSCSRCQTCGQNFTKKKLLEKHQCPNAAYPDSLPEHLQQFAAFR
ncbi:PR domain zinc finger protein 5-like [Culicoides brevitarsis]|uniref:PR domain zinc finger protein 5-like n=1 Tax=Culicoides brevitarsis TaxID=469753 RepID=UPI00307CB27E